MEESSEEEVEGTKELVHRVLTFRQTSRKPTTREARTYNAPSSGVAMSFISTNEMGLQRGSFYSLQAKGKVQAVSDLSSEYDLLGYRKEFF